MRPTLIASLLLLLDAALAQRQAPDPELFARFEPYINLTITVTLVLELEQESELPLTPEQAAQLMPVLLELDTSPGYTPERAGELLDAIELEVLTLEQLIWIDGVFLERQEAAAEGGGRGGFGGGQAGPFGGGAGQGGQPGGGQNPGGGGRPGGVFQQLANGEPINLFASNPGFGDDRGQGPGALLDELIVLVQAKLE